MATIKQVAAAAGVSPTTVSHVLNRTRFVSPATRSRVLQAIASLDYRPDAVARSLRRKETRTVGVLVSDVTNPFFTTLVRAVEDVAIAKGYSTILCDTDEDPARELTYLRILRGKRVDGLIVASTSENPAELRSLAADGIPLALVDRRVDGVEADLVTVDSRTGAREAVSYLIGLGHRRIGIITGPSGLSPARERYEGYLDAHREAGLAPDPALARATRFKLQDGRDAATQILTLQPAGARPTALFACNNVTTLGAALALKELGVRVPDELSLLGFDDSEWAVLNSPPVTVVAQPVAEIGKTAAGLLFERIARKLRMSRRHPPSCPEKGRTGPHPRVVVLTPKLLVRGSCTGPPSV